MANEKNKQGKKGKLVPWEIVSTGTQPIKEKPPVEKAEVQVYSGKDKTTIEPVNIQTDSSIQDNNIESSWEQVQDNRPKESLEEAQITKMLLTGELKPNDGEEPLKHHVEMKSNDEEASTILSRGKESFSPVALVVAFIVLAAIIIGLRSYDTWGHYFTTNKQTIKYSYGTYVGVVSSNKPNGNGELTFKDKSVLKGKFVNGQISGVARLTLPDGTYSEGTYINGKRDGWFTIIKNNSHYIYQQNYALDKLVGNEEKIVPLKVKDVKITNTGEGGKIIGNASSVFNRADIRFISSSITLTSSFPKEFKSKLQIKYIGPDGSFSSNPSTSPSGYSFERKVTISPGSNTINLGGWGNADVSNYKSGQHKIEYYWDGNLIGTATFTVQ